MGGAPFYLLKGTIYGGKEKGCSILKTEWEEGGVKLKQSRLHWKQAAVGYKWTYRTEGKGRWLILCWCRGKEGTEGRKKKVGGIKNKFLSLSQRFLSNDVGLAEIHSSSVTRGVATVSGVRLNWDDDGGGGGGGGGGAQFAMIEHSSCRSLLALTLLAAREGY